MASPAPPPGRASRSGSSPRTRRLGADAATAVRFTSGDHSSVLVPATDPVTQEMQRQIVNFLASDGQCLPLRGSCQ